MFGDKILQFATTANENDIMYTKRKLAETIEGNVLVKTGQWINLEITYNF